MARLRTSKRFQIIVHTGAPYFPWGTAVLLDPGQIRTSRSWRRPTCAHSSLISSLAALILKTSYKSGICSGRKVLSIISFTAGRNSSPEVSRCTYKETLRNCSFAVKDSAPIKQHVNDHGVLCRFGFSQVWNVAQSGILVLDH